MDQQFALLYNKLEGKIKTVKGKMGILSAVFGPK